jgi:hypothetical protein
MSVAIVGLGAEVDGSWVLEVPGRVTGRFRQSPVKLLDVDDQQYLVALDPQADWVRNRRAAPAGAALRRRGRHRPVVAEEVECAQRTPVLRAYLLSATRRKTLDLLGGGRRDADVSHLQRIAPHHPVFRLTIAEEES